MLYIYTDELSTYAARSNFNESDKIPIIMSSSELTEAFLGRSLAITDYTEIVRLSSGLSGWVSNVPITEIVSMKVRRIRKTNQGGYAVAADGWFSVSSDVYTQCVNLKTGRIDLFAPVWDGYNRFTTSDAGPNEKFEVEITYKSGLYASTVLTKDAEIGDTVITVEDSSAFQSGMKVTLGTLGTLHLVSSVEGTDIRLADPITIELLEFDELNQRVSKPIKLALGMICEDRVTFLPNVLRQSRRISVLTDSLRRSNTLPIPPDAMTILAKYRSRIWT